MGPTPYLYIYIWRYFKTQYHIHQNFILSAVWLYTDFYANKALKFQNLLIYSFYLGLVASYKCLKLGYLEIAWKPAYFIYISHASFKALGFILVIFNNGIVPINNVYQWNACTSNIFLKLLDFVLLSRRNAKNKEKFFC